MKKLLALVLALVMTMSLVTISNAAFTDADNVSKEEAVEVMTAVGVFKGYEDNSFKPTQNVTRAEAAKLIAYLDLGQKAADALEGSGKVFSDVAATNWAAGYIEYCASVGYVSGFDGKFDPANNVKGVEFAKMLLTVLGYDASIEEFQGVATWMINITKKANSNDLFTGVSQSVNAPLTRELAAQMCLNALKATIVDYENKGSSVDLGNGTVINIGNTAAAGVTSAADYARAIKGGNGDISNTYGQYFVQLGEKLYNGDLKVSKSSDDFNRPATSWKYKSVAVGTYADAPDLTYTKAVKSGDIYTDLGLSDTVPASDVTIYVNGEEADTTVAIKKGSDSKIGSGLGTQGGFAKNGVLTEVFYDDNNDTVIISQIVTYVGTVTKTVAATSKKDASVVFGVETGANNDLAVPADLSGKYVNGSLEFVTDEKFEDDAFVLYTYSFKVDEVKSLANATKVEGYVTKTVNKTSDQDQNNGMTIDGTDYKMSAAVAGEKLGEVSVKNDYTVYLDGYGYVIYIEEVKEIGNYALLFAAADKGSFVGKKAELVFTDGTSKVVETAKNYSDLCAEGKVIVTYRVDDEGVYTLRAVDTRKAYYNNADSAFKMSNGKAGITTENAGTLTANSASVFVIYDANDEDYTAYTGIKRVPSIAAKNQDSVGVYSYFKSGKMSTVMFLFPDKDLDIEDSNNKLLFLAKESVSNLTHDTDGDYYTFNGIVNGEIKEVKVEGVQGNKSLNGFFKGFSVDKYGIVTDVKNVSYGYDAGSDAKQYIKGAGVDKVSKEYTVILGSDTITVDENATYYYVDKDGDITASSYNAIRKDENDKFYAVVEDYLVKVLVIEEVPADEAPEAPVVSTGKITGFTVNDSTNATLTYTGDTKPTNAEVAAYLTGKGYTNVKFNGSKWSFERGFEAYEAIALTFVKA